MKIKGICILLFATFVLSNCATKYVPKMPKGIWVENNNQFTLSKRNKFMGKDSLVIEYFSNHNLKSIGKYALDNNGRLSELKSGNWTEYYENGTTKSKGEFKIGTYLDCGIGGLERAYYNYKYGLWSYYSSNGSEKARGKYIIGRYFIDTRCEGGDTINFGLTNKYWKFYNASITVKPEEFEKVINNSKELKTVLYYSREKKKMVIEEVYSK